MITSAQDELESGATQHLKHQPDLGRRLSPLELREESHADTDNIRKILLRKPLLFSRLTQGFSQRRNIEHRNRIVHDIHFYRAG